MPRPAPRLATLALAGLLAVAATLGGCGSTDDDWSLPGEPADPPDLSVRISPNDTVRVGETVTFAAVFRDSLNPKWEVRWNLTSADPAQQFKQGRQVTWVAAGAPRSYSGSVWVASHDATSRAYLGFTITILP